MKKQLTPEELFESLKNFGEQHTNSAIVVKYTRYFKEGYDAYGLTHDLVSSKVAEILSLPEMNLILVHETSLMLVRSSKYEMTVFAIQLVRSYHKSWTSETFNTVEHWFSSGITNWAQTDYICGELMNLFFKKGLANLIALESWRTADNKFQRRAAVVSLIKPMKLSEDFAQWFRFIEPMMHDPAREVHQGLGWFLRETWKKQPLTTEAFLLRFKDTSPRLIFQYATEKMTKEGKKRFRKSAATPF